MHRLATGFSASQTGMLFTLRLSIPSRQAWCFCTLHSSLLLHLHQAMRINLERVENSIQVCLHDVFWRSVEHSAACIHSRISVAASAESAAPEHLHGILAL